MYKSAYDDLCEYAHKLRMDRWRASGGPERAKATGERIAARIKAALAKRDSKKKK